MLRFFRKSVEQKGCCGIFFTSTPFGPLIWPLLEEFHFMLFNLVAFWFVIRKRWITLREFWFQFLGYFVHAFMLRRIVLLWLGFIFCGKNLSSFFWTLLLSILFCFWLKKKKNYNENFLLNAYWKLGFRYHDKFFSTTKDPFFSAFLVFAAFCVLSCFLLLPFFVSKEKRQ